MTIRVLTIVLTAVLATAACNSAERERAEAEAAAAAEAAKAAEANARAEAAAAREVERLASLWTYSDTPAGKGRQLSTYIYSTEVIDTGGETAGRVQLVFRDHAQWGRSSYLVLQGGDFDCYGGCTLQVTVDDTPAKPMAGRRPKTDEAIAMFVNDHAGLWALARKAKTISIAFPVRAGGTRTATFEVSGLDGTKMPKWDR